MTTLEDLSSDTWVVLQVLLSGFEIVRLCIAGSKRLNAKLFNTITELEFYWPSSSELLGWPRFVQNFTRLEKFNYHTGRVTARVEYFPTVNDLKLLSPTLQSLKLRCDGAEAALSNFSSDLQDLSSESEDDTESSIVTKKRRFKLVPTQDMELNIKKQWPNLRTLSLYQYLPYMADGAEMLPRHVESLPDTLHTLRLTNNTTLTGYAMALLPRNLSALCVATLTLQSEYFQHLPPTLERLECIFDNSLPEDFVKLPRSLKRLTIFVKDSSVPLDFFAFFPPIWHLNLRYNTSYADFGPSITQLTQLRSLDIDSSFDLILPHIASLSHLCYLYLGTVLVRPSRINLIISQMQKHASTIATKKPRFEASLTTRRRQLYEVSLDELNRMLSSLSDPEDAWQHLPNERWAYLVQNLVFRALELSNVNNWDS